MEGGLEIISRSKLIDEQNALIQCLCNEASFDHVSWPFFNQSHLLKHFSKL